MGALYDLASSKFEAISQAYDLIEYDAKALPRATFSDALVKVLCDLGVEHAFGIVGGAIAPFSEAMLRSKLRVVHTRHEAGAVFSATEAYFATGKTSLVFVTTGPGVLNSLIGVHAARWDGANLIVVSGSTASPQRGRWASQETSGYTMPLSGLYTAGPLFHYAVAMESPTELDVVVRRLMLGLTRPGGFVAHISLPIGLQTVPLESVPGLAPCGMRPAGSNYESVVECARMLSSGPFAMWVGFGCRNAADRVRRFAERTGCAVFSSPRAKGIFPEDHPQFVGVTGLGGHASVKAYLARHRPQHTLVLGTRLGESTSFWEPHLVPPKGFIQVDLDPDAIGVAYPQAKTFGVQAEIGEFLQQLMTRFPSKPTQAPPAIDRPPVAEMPPGKGKVRPTFLMQEIQRVIVDQSDAVVMTEAGNAFAFGNHCLRFAAPGRYRVSSGFGAMGHFTTGVVGAALARRGKAVVVTGDGAMLMNNEVSTAVKYGAPAVWIVLNDGRYGMVDQGMRALGLTPVETEFPACDFLAFARSMGAGGVRVEKEKDLRGALREALSSKGPFVVDVVIDPDEPSPVLMRIESLIRQGASAQGMAEI